MSELKQHNMDIFFYQELINRFFQSHSYFFLCIKYYLENSSIFKTDDAIRHILDKVVTYLAESKDAAAELSEISKIKGLDNCYLALESRLVQINFRTLQPTQFKKTIQNLAVFLLNTLTHQLAENTNCRTDLETYLQLKLALRQLLKGTNGTIRSRNDKLEHSQQINNPSLNGSSSNFTSTRVIGTFHDKPSSTSIMQDFNHEINAMLHSLSKYLPQNYDATTQAEFVAAAHTCFYRLLGLAMYAGADPVQKIAERVIKLLEIVKNHHVPINDFMLELIHRARTSIQSKAYLHQNHKILTDLFDDYDQYLALLNEQISNRQQQRNQGEHLCHAENQCIVAESNESTVHFAATTQEEISNPRHFSNGAEAAVTQSKINIELARKDSQAHATEKSDDLKSHLPQNHESKKTAALTESSIAATKVEYTTPAFNLPELLSIANNGNDNNCLYSAVFSAEAEVYCKMILNATMKLKGEGNAQSCLEDIELASHLIKQLAQKFGMEKISAIPEIIESLSYQANKRLVKLPLAIVQNIEEAVSLLAIFDHHQPDHKIRFTSILASLKQYYAKTFQSEDSISLAS